jgi:O-acetyl-ADP-ribose deacetylase (regulator of RNase III)
MNPTKDHFHVGSAVVRLLQGDITKQDTDAIVNAANSSLVGGGGVDGAIHRAGGPAILEACQDIVAESGRCETGEAVITTAGDLPARRVIHTVGPVYRGGRRGEAELLANAYRNSCRLAVENQLRSISFPSISTGAYGYPVDQASAIALRTVFELLKTEQNVDEIRFVLFSGDDLNVYREAAATAYQETVG